MPLVPHRFLFRLAYPCRYVKKMPLRGEDRLLGLPVECRLDNFAAMDEKADFADLAVAWNELGLGLEVEVRGKDNPPQGDTARLRASDGITLWLDTRDARAGHRASRTCHQFHFLASGGGSERDEPAFVQTTINRALEDAPLARAGSVPLRVSPGRMVIAWRHFFQPKCCTATIPNSIPAWDFSTPYVTKSWASRS